MDMDDISGLPAWLSIGGVILGYPTIRYLWPVLRDSLAAQGGQWRKENEFLTQTGEELKQVKAERDANREKLNRLIIRNAQLHMHNQMLAAQLKAAGVEPFAGALDSPDAYDGSDGGKNDRDH